MSRYDLIQSMATLRPLAASFAESISVEEVLPHKLCLLFLFLVPHICSPALTIVMVPQMDASYFLVYGHTRSLTRLEKFGLAH